MRAKVPRNVQREDTILWFITFRQFLMLLVGFGISYFMYVNMNKHYHLNQIDIFLCWLPAILAVAFAFFKVHSIPLFQWILLLIETFFRAPRRYWLAHGDNLFVSLTTVYNPKGKKTGQQKAAPKEVSRKDIKNVAAMLDGEKKKK